MKIGKFASALLFFNYSLILSFPTLLPLGGAGGGLSSLSRQLLRQDTLQFLGGESQLELAADGNRDAARLFADDDSHTVALMGDA